MDQQNHINLRRKIMAIENDTKDIIFKNYIKRKKKERVLGDFFTREEKAKKLKKLYAQKKAKPTLDEWLETVDPGGWQSEEDVYKPKPKHISVDDLILAQEYWDEEWDKADPDHTKFKNVREFINWATANTDIKLAKGGIASLKNARLR